MVADPLVTSQRRPDAMPAELRFELGGRIGAGNHGVVFRAHDRQLRRDVAIKRFSHFLADDPRAMRRITREVATVARVSHPHVITVHDLVHMADGDGEITPHLVMELVVGTSLRDLLARHGPSLRSVSVVRDVLEGLAACHRAGILHLDIKPANVLVTETGGVKIVDFGIARAASDSTATVSGTPHYMAPEQYDGLTDERSDIYSVGCLLYECLTGRPPFEGTMASQLMAHRNRPRPDPRVLAPEVGPGLAAVVMRAMAIEPDARYADVDAMLAALARPDAAAPAVAPEPSPDRAAPVVPADVRPVDAEPAVRGWEGTDVGVVTRWSKLATLGAGLVLSGFAVALVPGLVWTTTGLSPGADFRPAVMRDSSTTAWWFAAVSIALLLLLRRGEFVRRLSGPPLGERRESGVVGPHTWSGVRAASWAALAGSLPMLFPWYVALVAGGVRAAGGSWPSDVYGSGWTVAWVLLPLASVVLVLRATTRLRPRLGALFMFVVYLGLATVAAAAFVAYPAAF
ncbi:serine/threonine-protein kinase [Solicola sp. PLA-1-18]|uniref:serine/threonine-protein kinase n=1 Tax=Solicola sp. PLA-1-18 TaxID=3380532 RepID=UPI003B76482F